MLPVAHASRAHTYTQDTHTYKQDTQIHTHLHTQHIHTYLHTYTHTHIHTGHAGPSASPVSLAGHTAAVGTEGVT